MPIITQWAKDLNDSERMQVRQESEKYLGQNQQRCAEMMDAFLHHWSI